MSFSEVLVVLTLVLVFFGSKELPRFVREIAGILAKFRRYSERLKRELDEAAGVNEQFITDKNPVQESKNQKREHYISLRKGLGLSLRAEKSRMIIEHLKSTPQYRDAAAVMIYVSIGSEVETRTAISDMLSAGKRVVVPYCVSGARSLGIAEIKDPEKDLLPGEMNIPEPRKELRDKFFKSDLQLVICPGVAFDILGGRLGRGKAYYDGFLRELKGKIPLFGLAFDCQTSQEALPFDYHDVHMDQIITESGLIIDQAEARLPAADLDRLPAG
ncbi:MAG: 5-formyltetrahydrofolate cyclo-ligase [Fibrobacter sp.]|nr:5-formyltetrahydrofolate cyclo-ligase [Fibrobacter sp.]